jgi:hypothetical protein
MSEDDKGSHCVAASTLRLIFAADIDIKVDPYNREVKRQLTQTSTLRSAG